MLADKPFLSVDEVDKYSEQSVSSLNYLLLECLPAPKGKNPSGNKSINTDDIPFEDSLHCVLFWSTLIFSWVDTLDHNFDSSINYSYSYTNKTVPESQNKNKLSFWADNILFMSHISQHFSSDETKTIKGHARHSANQLGKAEGMVTLLRASN